MSRLFKDTTLGKEDRHFLHMYKTLDQYHKEKEAMSYHSFGGFVGPMEKHTLRGRKFFSQAKDFYSPRDGPHNSDMLSNSNLYHNGKEVKEMSNHTTEPFDMERYDPHGYYDVEDLLEPEDYYGAMGDYYSDDEEDEDYMPKSLRGEDILKIIKSTKKEKEEKKKKKK